MPRLAITVYLSDPAAQDQLLIEVVGPLAARQLRSDSLRHLWFDRFETGVPHLLVVATLAEGHPDTARSAWREAVEEFLSRLAAAAPPVPSAGDEAADPSEPLSSRKPLLGREDGTFLLFEYEDEAPPFRWSRGLPTEEPFWSTVDELAFWSIEQLEEGPQRRRLLAVAWMADLDGTLAEAGWPAKPFWRSCALRVSPALASGLDGSLELEAALAARLSPNQRAVLDRTWLAVRQYGGPWPQMRRWIELALARREDGGDSWRLLAELVPAFLKGLGLSESQAFPLLLHAWSYQLPPRQGGAGPASPASAAPTDPPASNI